MSSFHEAISRIVTFRDAREWGHTAGTQEAREHLDASIRSPIDEGKVFGEHP